MKGPTGQTHLERTVAQCAGREKAALRCWWVWIMSGSDVL